MGIEVSGAKVYYSCEAGHKLKYDDSNTGYNAGQYTCSICKQCFSCQQKRYNCFMCKWDICMNCAEQYRPKAVQMMKCTAGHKLEYKENKYPMGYFTCAQCNRNYQCHIKRWNCKQCNFDICFFCRPPGILNESLPLPTKVTPIVFLISRTYTNRLVLILHKYINSHLQCHILLPVNQDQYLIILDHLLINQLFKEDILIQVCFLVLFLCQCLAIFLLILTQQLQLVLILWLGLILDQHLTINLFQHQSFQGINNHR